MAWRKENKGPGNQNTKVPSGSGDKSSKPKVVRKATLQNRLWGLVTTQYLRDQIHEYRPEVHVRESGSALQLNCIYHSEDHDPSLLIDPHKRMAKCFGASCGHYENDVVQILADIRRCPYDEVLSDLAIQFKIDGLENTIKEAKSLKEAYQAHELFFRCCTLFLEEHLAEPGNPEYLSARVAADYLQNNRKLTYIKDVTLVGVIPPMHFFQKIDAPIEVMKEVTRLVEGIQDAKYIGQIVFPYHTTNGKISYFKIRVIKDMMDSPTEIHNNQREFKIIHHPLIITESHGDKFPLFGLPYFKESFIPVEGEIPTITLVEGEFDQMSLVSNQLLLGHPKTPILALGGSSNIRDLALLRDVVKECNINVLFDRPEAKGDELALQLLKSNTYPYRVRVFNWEQCSLLGKDADEILSSIARIDSDDKTQELSSAYSTLMLEDTNYIENFDFVRKVLTSKIDKALTTIKGRSPHTIRSIISNDLNSFINPYIYHELIDDLCKRYQVESTLVKSSLKSSGSSEQVFIDTLRKELLKVFSVMGVMVNDERKRTFLCLWMIKSKREYRLPYTFSKTDSFFPEEIGTLIYFVGKTVGIPSFIKFSDAECLFENSILTIEASLSRYVAHILRELATGAPLLSDSSANNRFRGGVFLLDNPNSPHKEIVIHNGNYLFQGSLKDPEDIYSEYQFIEKEVPIILGSVFEIDNEVNKDDVLQWSNVLTNALVFNKEWMPLKDIFEEITFLIDQAFNLKHQIDNQVIALVSMYAAIFPLFSSPVLIRITGESSSGKTRLAQGIIGGKVNPETQVVETVSAMANYTEAAMRQFISQYNLMLSLDEFEDTGNKDDESTRTAKKILTDFRTIDSKSKVMKGTPGGKVKFYRMNVPVIILGIRPLEDAADLNRFLPIETAKVVGYPDSSSIISGLRSRGHMDYLRSSTTITPIRNIRKIERYYRCLEEICAKAEKESTIFGIPARTLDKLIPLASIKAASYDSMTEAFNFIMEYYIQHAGEINMIKEVSHTKELMDVVLNNEVYVINKTKDDAASSSINKKYSLAEILAVPALREQLLDKAIYGARLVVTNNRSTLRERGYYLVINWLAARDLLVGKSEYASYPPLKLKQVADRHTLVVKYEDSRVITAITKRLSMGSSESYAQEMLSNATVFKISNLIRDAIKETDERLLEKELSLSVDDINNVFRSQSDSLKPLEEQNEEIRKKNLDVRETLVGKFRETLIKWGVQV